MIDVGNIIYVLITEGIKGIILLMGVFLNLLVTNPLQIGLIVAGIIVLAYLARLKNSLAD